MLIALEKCSNRPFGETNDTHNRTIIYTEIKDILDIHRMSNSREHYLL